MGTTISTGGTSSTGSTGSSEAAARAAAERAAAVARQKAEEAKQRALEAQQAAREAHAAAAAARETNRTAQADKSSARTELDGARSKLDTLNRTIDERGPRPGQLEAYDKAKCQVADAQKKYDAASTRADATARAQTDAEAKDTTARQAALDSGNAAISTQKTANTAAQSAGKEQPYAAANQVKDVYDAGSLDAKGQEQLFGTRSVVTPEEAAKADTQRVADAAKQGPRQGAEELQRQLQGNADPAYRKALLDGSGPALDQIAKGLSNPALLQPDANATVKALAGAADLGGDDARNQIAGSLNRGTGFSFGNLLGVVGGQKADAALEAQASDPSVAKLGGAMAENARQAGNYERADALGKLDPKIAAASTESKGEAQARDAVKVTTVGDEKAALEKGINDGDKQVRDGADQVFATAGKDPKELPPGVEAVKGTDPNRAELIARDPQGNVTARTIAVRDGDNVTLTKTQYADGKAKMTRTSSGPGGYDNASAQWNEAASRSPKAAPSLDDLKNSRDPDVQIQQQALTHQDGKLVETDYSQGEKGISQTTKTYSQQSKGDASHSGGGIKDDFQDKFDDSKPVDVVDTHTINVPAAGVKNADGDQAKVTISDSSTFSQDGLRLERDAKPAELKGDVKDGFRPAASDLAELDQLPDMLKEDKGAVQWKLEESSGNSYDSQTFVEGHTDLSVKTHREAHGSSVTEDVSGKVPSSDGKDTVDLSSHTDQTYAADGSVASLHRDSKDADGSHTVTDFDRTTKPGPDGLEIDEHTRSKKTDADGKTVGLDRTTQSRLSNQGVQLLSSDETLTGADGTTGRTRIDGSGTTSFINGSEVNDPAALAGYSPDAQALVSQSGADTFKEAKTYIAKGGSNAVKLLAIGKDIEVPAGSSPTALTEANNALNQKLVDRFGQENVDTAYRVQGGAVGGLKALAGLAGVVSSTSTLVDGIRDADFGKIATGLAGDVQNGLAVKSGGQAFVNAIKGFTPAAVQEGELAAKTAGWLSKVPGISDSLAASGGALTENASEFLGKFGGAASVVGVALSGYNLYNAIQSGNGYKIAEASVGLGAAIATGAVLGSVEPGLGTVIGAGIGLAAYGVEQLIGLFDHSDTDIADVKI